jgi:hypothetical protein
MTYPSSPQIVAGTRTLMIALQVLEQQSPSDRLPNVAPLAAFWAKTSEAAELVSGGLAAYAPLGTTLPAAEPPHTVNQVPGFGAGTSNCSH